MNSTQPNPNYGPVDSDGFAPFELVRENIEGHHVTFRKADAYGNLTELCRANNKLPYAFLRLPETKAFIAALDEQLNSKRNNDALPRIESVITIRGGKHPGTWAHPQLMMQAARWISPEFAIACNEIVFRHVSGDGPVPLTTPVLPAPVAALPEPSALTRVLEPLFNYLADLEDRVTHAEGRVAHAEGRLDNHQERLIRQRDILQSINARTFRTTPTAALPNINARTLPPALTWSPRNSTTARVTPPPAPDVTLPSPQFMRTEVRRLVTAFVRNRFGEIERGNSKHHRQVFLSLYTDLRRLTGFDVHAQPDAYTTRRSVSLIHRVEGEGLLGDLYRLAQAL